MDFDYRVLQLFVRHETLIRVWNLNLIMHTFVCTILSFCSSNEIVESEFGLQDNLVGNVE